MSDLRARLGQAQITKGALYLLCATAAMSLLYFLSTDDIRRQVVHWLIATPNGVWAEGKIWQLVTSPLIEVKFVMLLLHGFMLWMFLPALERWWGMKRFLLFALYTSLAGSIAGTFVGLFVAAGPSPVAGLSPFVFAGIVAYGRMFANQQVSFFGVLPMTGRQLTIGIIVLTLLMIFFGQDWAYGASMVAAMALAFLITSERYSPRLWWLKRKQKKLRAKLSVVKDGDEPKRWVN